MHTTSACVAGTLSKRSMMNYTMIILFGEGILREGLAPLSVRLFPFGYLRLPLKKGDIERDFVLCHCEPFPEGRRGNLMDIDIKIDKWNFS